MLPSPRAQKHRNLGSVITSTPEADLCPLFFSHKTLSIAAVPSVILPHPSAQLRPTLEASHARACAAMQIPQHDEGQEFHHWYERLIVRRMYRIASRHFVSCYDASSGGTPRHFLSRLVASSRFCQVVSPHVASHPVVSLHPPPE